MAERIVFIYLDGQTSAVPAGRLRMLEQGPVVTASTFAYGTRYVQRRSPRALPVDPVSLPLESGGNGGERAPYAGLAMFGALRDAAPDAWGRRVIENRLRAPPNGLPESAYLDGAGPYRAGALDVRMTPTSGPSPGGLPGVMELGHLLDAAQCVEMGEPVPAHLKFFFAGGPSLGGARPKAVLSDSGTEWIAKFPARGDPFDIEQVEYATLELARSAGLDVPAVQLQTLADGRHVFMVERFDRQRLPHGLGRRHMVSALTLLARHEQDSPDAGYGELADALGRYGVSAQIARDRKELFARMVFNVLVSNDDDHLRNHAFLCAPGASGWRLSPLYDVVPKPQAGTERTLHLAVGPQGRAARLDNALGGAGRFGLLRPEATAIIERVVAAVRPWREVFERLGVPKTECDKISSAFRRAGDIGMDAVRSRA